MNDVANMRHPRGKVKNVFDNYEIETDEKSMNEDEEDDEYDTNNSMVGKDSVVSQEMPTTSTSPTKDVAGWSMVRSRHA